MKTPSFSERVWKTQRELPPEAAVVKADLLRSLGIAVPTGAISFYVHRGSIFFDVARPSLGQPPEITSACLDIPVNVEVRLGQRGLIGPMRRAIDWS